MTRICVATNQDRENIRAVHLRAFPEGEKQIVSTLAINLLSEKTNPETFALIAKTHGTVVGHIAFSPVTVDNNEKWKGYILAPLGVKPEYQKRRIGSKLIESGIERLSEKGVNVLFVYGDPTYYGKFGFNADAASRYSPPYPLQYPFGWQAITLNDAGFAESNAKISCVASLHDPELW
jgi:putative acetyltransferase